MLERMLHGIIVTLLAIEQPDHHLQAGNCLRKLNTSIRGV